MLTTRDCAVIESIKRFGALNTNQITRLHFSSLKPNSAVVKARESLRRIRSEKDTGIKYKKDNYTGLNVYFAKNAQIRHKQLIAEFYLQLLVGPGKILEFEVEYNLGGSYRADAFAAYEYQEKVLLFCLEVHISNNRLDLDKYRQSGWMYPVPPRVVIVTDRRWRTKEKTGVYALNTYYDGWEKILK